MSNLVSHLKFIYRNLSSIIVSLFFTLNVWAGQTTFYIDKTEILGIEISVNTSIGQDEVVLSVHSAVSKQIPKKTKDVLKNHLKIVVNGEELSQVQQSNTEAIKFADLRKLFQRQMPADIYITLAGVTLAHIQYVDDKFVKLKNSPLTVGDLRQFQTLGTNYLSTFIESHKALKRISYRPIADLHTHFGGALRPETIINVSLKKGLTYPTSFLDEMKISYEMSKVSGGYILLSDLSELELRKLAENLSLDPLRRESFERMELCYKYRGPLVKSIGSFEDFLWALARDYKSFGVKYVETSLSDVLKPEWLEVAHGVLPQIEKELGVRLTFNVGLWRHSDPVYNSDMIERVRHFKSPYIVGIDFMGHESNSTWAIENNIKEAVALRSDPGMAHFQVRVHSGESPYFLENTSAAISMGATRIGHGIYSSVDDIKRAAEKDVIMELQVISNLSLNSSDGAIHLKELIKYAEGLAIGTDGHGLYGTDPESELTALISAGVESRLPEIEARERQHVETMNTAIDRLLSRPNSLKVDYNIPLGRYNEVYKASQNRKKAEKLKAFTKILTDKGFVLDSLENLLSKDFAEMRPIWISGASRSSWPNISDEDKKKIINALDMLILNIDWSKHFVTLGLTKFGVEGEMMKLLKMRAEKFGINIKVLLIGVKDLGEYVSKDADVTSVNSYENIGYGTHATLLGEKWYDTTSHMLKLLERTKGHVIFIGGGGVIRDQIDASDRLGLNYLIMNGPAGASTNKAPVYPKHTFNSSNDLLKSLIKAGVSTRNARAKRRGVGSCKLLLKALHG